MTRLDLLDQYDLVFMGYLKLQPVFIHYSTYLIKDSFEFAGFIQKHSPLNKFMCSFDICSLFTCVPILETIDICADMLYRSYLTPPNIPEVVFVELMKFATTYVEFSFDIIMYRHFDGLSFRSYYGWYFCGFPYLNIMDQKCTSVMLMILFVYLGVRLINFSHIWTTCTLPLDLLWRRRIIPL